MPQLAHSLGLPAANRLGFDFGLLRCQLVFQGKAAHGRTMSSQPEPAEQFGGYGTVATAMFKQLPNLCLNLPWPRFASIPA